MHQAATPSSGTCTACSSSARYFVIRLLEGEVDYVSRCVVVWAAREKQSGDAGGVAALRSRRDALFCTLAITGISRLQLKSLIPFSCKYPDIGCVEKGWGGGDGFPCRWLVSVDRGVVHRPDNLALCLAACTNAQVPHMSRVWLPW